MHLHIHKLDKKKHHAFLQEKRQDPVTKEYLAHGDEIVICANEKIAYLAASWQAGSKCPNPQCNYTETLAALPEQPAFGRIGKKNTSSTEKKSAKVDHTVHKSKSLCSRIISVTFWIILIILFSPLFEHLWNTLSTPKTFFISKNVNIRNKPTAINNKPITSLSCGVQVKKLSYTFSPHDDEQKWYYVRTVEGIEGWMWAGNNDDRLQKIEEEKFLSIEQREISKCPSVNFRTEPAQCSNKIIELSCGVQVQVLGSAPSLTSPQHKWYHIRTEDDKEGWVFAGTNDDWLKKIYLNKRLLIRNKN